MKCVILVAGHGTQLESDIRDQGPRNLVGIPKGLVSVFFRLILFEDNLYNYSMFILETA